MGLLLIVFLGIAILFASFALNKLRVARSDDRAFPPQETVPLLSPTPRPSAPET